MKKFFTVTILSTVFLLGGASAMAQEVATSTSTSTSGSATDITALQAQIQSLLGQIDLLKAQIAAMQNSNTSTQSDIQHIQQVLQISGPLHKGMHGDDVKHLQDVLATDKDIFSKDNATGFYGALTEKAVERFQKHFGFDVVGQVGPKTMEKINELLKEHQAEFESDLSENDLGDLGDSEDGVIENNNQNTSANDNGALRPARDADENNHVTQ